MGMTCSRSCMCNLKCPQFYYLVPVPQGPCSCSLGSIAVFRRTNKRCPVFLGGCVRSSICDIHVLLEWGAVLCCAVLSVCANRFRFCFTKKAQRHGGVVVRTVNYILHMLGYNMYVCIIYKKTKNLKTFYSSSCLE